MATTPSRRTPRIVVLRMVLELISDAWFRSWRGMMLDFLDDVWRRRHCIAARNLDGFESLILVDTPEELAAGCYPARARSALRSTEAPHAGHLSCPRRPDSTR